MTDYSPVTKECRVAQTWRPLELAPRGQWGRGGGQTWGGAETLLGARVHAVHAPVISEEGNAAQAAHCVHQQQCAVLVAQFPQAGQALVHPCAALPLQLHTYTLRP